MYTFTKLVQKGIFKIYSYKIKELVQKSRRMEQIKACACLSGFQVCGDSQRLQSEFRGTALNLIKNNPQISS